MSRRTLALLIFTLLVSIACHDRNNQNPSARHVAEGFAKIDEWALDPPADEELVAGAMRGMVDVLRRRGDEHSRFLRPRRAQQLRDEISGEFGGVGVQIRMGGDPPRLIVAAPPEPGLPASGGGGRRGDWTQAIAGAATADMTMDDVLEGMRGPEGDPVTLKIARGDAATPIDVELVREIIRVPSIVGDRRLSDGSWEHLLVQDKRVALLRFRSFGDQTVKELQDAVAELEGQGMRALVIDLRDNPGGTLDAGVDACDLFLPRGAPIVETRGRDGRVRESFASRNGQSISVPVAVLINRNSASASEIVAACLQDNGRAKVFGERSFGKGTVQRLEPIGAGRATLKITFASFWRPSGDDIHRRPGVSEDEPWGVQPAAGDETTLSEEQHIAYQTWRRERDVVAIDEVAIDEVAGDTAATNGPESGDKAPWSIGNADALGTAAEEEPKGGSANAGSTAQPNADEVAEDAPSPSEAAGQSQPLAKPPFVDRPLQRAVEYLQSLIDSSAGSTNPLNPAA
ncbi:MAG: S41 family peptidase [Planctomycetota bacterium]